MILSKKPAKNTLVLVVDDNKDNLHLIEYVLKTLNLKCYGTNDSKMALDLAVEKTPKLILLDIVMPYVSGFEVIRQLKSNLFTRNIPVIAVTGLSELYYQSKIKSAGFEDYISKPFMLEELENKVTKCLDLRSFEAAA